MNGQGSKPPRKDKIISACISTHFHGGDTHKVKFFPKKYILLTANAPYGYTSSMAFSPYSSLSLTLLLPTSFSAFFFLTHNHGGPSPQGGIVLLSRPVIFAASQLMSLAHTTLCFASPPSPEFILFSAISLSPSLSCV